MAVQLDAELLEILACPCPAHGTLSIGTPETGTMRDGNPDYLLCASCGRKFPVRDGIPVLLLDEADEPTGPTATDPSAGETPKA